MLNGLLDKLTSYKFFNYLLPGAVFAYFAKIRLGTNLVPDDLFTAAFVYYFIGIVVSRFGSLVVEPLLKKVRLVKFVSYAEFISASEKSSKLETLLEEANMYRTFLSIMLLLLFLDAYFKIETIFPSLMAWHSFIGELSLTLVFLFAYRKQINYIVSRVRNKNE